MSDGLPPNRSPKRPSDRYDMAETPLADAVLDLPNEDDAPMTPHRLAPPRMLNSLGGTVALAEQGPHNASPSAPMKAGHGWMLTFTDLLLLLITFFVMLAALGEPKTGLPSPLTSAVATASDIYGADSVASVTDSSPQSLGARTVIRGVNLDYLAVLLDRQINGEDGASALIAGAENIAFTRQSDRLIISLPGDLLFASGAVALSPSGENTVRQLGEVLMRLRNQVAVYGHADPDPVGQSGATSNWALSLQRAISVAGTLEGMGYPLPVRPHGLSDSRYGDLPSDISQAERYRLSRRVDIVILAEGNEF